MCDRSGCTHDIPFSAFGHDSMGTIGTATTLCGSDIADINMIAVQTLEKRTAELRLKTLELETLQRQIASLEARIEKLENY